MSDKRSYASFLNAMEEVAPGCAIEVVNDELVVYTGFTLDGNLNEFVRPMTEDEIIHA